MVERQSSRYRIAVPDGQAGLRHFGQALELLDADLWLDADWMTIEDGGALDMCVLAGECLDSQSLAARAAVRRNVPTLLVMDGVLEWRNTWEHYADPETALAMPLLQPVLAHKVACMGQRQAEWLEDFGNHGLCESVGLPRLDRLLERCGRRLQGDTRRLLVASATRPAFDAKQWNVVERAFDDLVAGLHTYAKTSPGLALEVVWRVSERLAKHLGIDPSDERPLPEVLAAVDAVISTPSTLVVEAMLAKRPVAVLDYFDTPAFVATAWRIGSAAQVRSVLRELFSPPPARLFHQEAELSRQLRLDGLAAPRLADLMEKMIVAGRLARQRGVPLELPARMVPLPDAPTFDCPPLTARFPDNVALRERDIAVLQAEVAHLRSTLKNEVAAHRRDLAEIESSYSLRAGRALTWPARKLWQLTTKRKRRLSENRIV